MFCAGAGAPGADCPRRRCHSLRHRRARRSAAGPRPERRRRRAAQRRRPAHKERRAAERAVPQRRRSRAASAPSPQTPAARPRGTPLRAQARPRAGTRTSRRRRRGSRVRQLPAASAAPARPRAGTPAVGVPARRKRSGCCCSRPWSSTFLVCATASWRAR